MNTPNPEKDLQKGATKEDDPFNVQYWAERWTTQKIGFHKPSVNSNLLRHIQLVTGQPLTTNPLTDSLKFSENGNCTWFIPLCGKSVDIPYLLGQGYRVFGVEAVKQAIDELEAEHQLGLVFDQSRSLFTGAKGRLSIYVGDLFRFPVEEYGPFDYVWDRGSFSAVEYWHRPAYAEVMQRALIKPGKKFRYLLEVVTYESTEFKGPPKCTSDGDMNTYFRTWADVQLLSAEPPPADTVLFKELDGQVKLRAFLLTPK